MSDLIARSGDFDVGATLSLDFINRAVTLAIAAGAIPSKFSTQSAFADGDIGLSGTLSAMLEVTQFRAFCVAGEDRELMVEVKFDGTISLHTMLATLARGAASMRSQPQLDDSESIAFSGQLQATASLSLQEIDGSRYVLISFAALQDFDLFQIGDLAPGPAFSELVRDLVQRYAIVELKSKFKLPNVNGLVGSLPAPLNEVLGTPSGQIGLIDFKCTSAQAGYPYDEVHIVIESGQNLGQENYANLKSLLVAGTDVGATLSYRLVKQVLNDLWLGGALPRQFSDKGLPDPQGTIFVMSLDVLFREDSLGLMLSLKKNFAGIDVTLGFEVDFSVDIIGGELVVQLDHFNADVDFAWTRAPGISLVFVFLWEVVLRLAFKAADAVLIPLSVPLLQKILDSQKMKPEQKIPWKGTPFTVDIALSGVAVSSEAIHVGSSISIEK